jgi:hypothetical protein
VIVLDSFYLFLMAFNKYLLCNKLPVIWVRIFRFAYYLCTIFFSHKCRHMWTSFLTSLRTILSASEEGGGGCFFGGSPEYVVKRYPFFFVLYGQCRWCGGDFCSNGHVDGERGCYRCDWSFSNICVLQSILLHCTVHWMKMIVNTCGS